MRSSPPEQYWTETHVNFMPPNQLQLAAVRIDRRYCDGVYRSLATIT